MAETYNVFISWSGERSEKVALALHDWLPTVIQLAKPWMSKVDIETGSRSLEEIGKALETMSIGILCLTPENADKPWIHFEAGALSKTYSENMRVCPYTFGELEPQDVKFPLGIFQGVNTDRGGTQKMVLSVNRALGASIPDDAVAMWFERAWPDLEKKLDAIPPMKLAAAPQRSEKEMFAQILELIQVGAVNNARAVDEIRGLREIIARLESRYTPFVSAFNETAWANVLTPNVTGSKVIANPVLAAGPVGAAWVEPVLRLGEPAVSAFGAPAGGKKDNE